MADEFPLAITGSSPQPFDTAAIEQRSLRFEQGGIAGNPAVVNLVTGTGKLFERFGLDARTGIRLGGLYVGDLNALLTKGLVQRRVTGNSLLIASISVDTQQFMRLPGGLFDIEFLQFNGQPTNAEAGTVQGYNNLPSLPPLNRTQMFQLWYRQAMFDEHFVIRFGKTIIPQDFGNLVHPLALRSEPLSREAISGLIYRPVFANPVTFGFMPGLYTAAWGGNATFFPNARGYASIGLYDGSYAHDFDLTIFNTPGNGPYRLMFAELGGGWSLAGKPGSFAFGAFGQTGTLATPHIKNGKVIGKLTERGAQGFYTFATQRLWFAHPGVDTSGIVAALQFGMNNSHTRPVKTFFGALMTFFGLVPLRERDSFGLGLAQSWLNKEILPRSTETMLQGYYQANLVRSSYFVGALSYIPNPGLSAKLSNVVALTARLIVLF